MSKLAQGNGALICIPRKIKVLSVKYCNHKCIMPRLHISVSIIYSKFHEYTYIGKVLLFDIYILDEIL